VTGQISAQDVRDFLVTVMEAEFANPGDFWKNPSPREISTDRTGKGWIDYSQQIASTCSFGTIMQMDDSGAWIKASFNGNSLLITTLGVALESYLSETSIGQILRRGLYVHSKASTMWTGSMGKPFVVLSGTAGSMTRTLDQSETVVLGWPEPMHSANASTGHIFRFEPGWAAVGTIS
jgi:hypothetical protein